MVFHELLNNLTLLVTIVLFFSLVVEKYPYNIRLQNLFYGVIFGLAAIIGMQNSFYFSEGIVYDGRSVILGIAGLFGGPVGAAVSALIAGAYRLYLGGAGVVAGIGTVLSSALLGTLFYYLVRTNAKRLNPYTLYGFGVLVNGTVLLWMFTLPADIVWTAIKTVGIPLMILFPLATVLVGMILIRQKRAIMERIESGINEQRYRLAMEATSDGIWDADIVQGTVLYSPVWKKMLGYAENEIGTSAEEWRSRIHEEDRERLKETIARHMQNPKLPFEATFRMQHKDGSIVWILSRGGAIFDEEGSVVRMVGTHTDITAQKQAEERLQHLNDNLHAMVHQEVEKNREREQMLIHHSKLASLGEMLGAIAHHWRQPLTAVSLNIQNIYDLYQHGELDEAEMKMGVESALHQIDAMSRTIDEFRRFFDPGTTREHFLLQTALTDLQNLLQPELNEKHIRFEIRQQEEELRINGYQNRFKQALLNLVSNARDAIGTARCEGILPRTVEGKISLDVSVEAGWIVLELTDNGGGIDAGLMDKIFDPYFSTKGQGEGVGLGLYMSRVIIEKYFGGSVTVKNIQGGLSVTVRLSPDAA